MKKHYLVPLLLLLISGFGLPSVHAGDLQQIQSILAEETPPDGVVFEIISNKDGLQWAIPRVQSYAAQLREKFPQLAIAVVSHGREQFALQSSKQKQYPAVHQQVQSLVGDKVQVHVCGTYAEWKGVSPEEFPDYVDVAAEGPAQIRSYQELGYLLVQLKKPD